MTLAIAHRCLDYREPSLGVGLVAWQLDEDERDAVAELPGGAVVAHAHGDHRLEWDRFISVIHQESTESAGRRREQHVVDRPAVGALDSAQVVERPVRPTEASAR